MTWWELTATEADEAERWRAERHAQHMADERADRVDANNYERGSDDDR